MINKERNNYINRKLYNSNYLNTLGFIKSAYKLSNGKITGTLSLIADTVGSVNLALGAVGTITAIIAAIKGISDAIESAKFEKAEQLSDGFDDAKTSIDEYKVKVDELKTELESGNLTEQEAYDKKSQLFDIQQNLIIQYGESAKGLDLVNGSLETQIGLLDQLSQQKADDYLNDIDREYGIDKVVSAMEKEGDYYLGTARSIDKVTLEPMFNKYGIAFDDAFYDNGTGEYKIYFTGNITDIQDKLSELRKEIKNISDEGLRDYLENNLIGGIDATLDSADAAYEKYKSVYDSIISAQMILNKDRIQTPYDAEKPDKTPSEIYQDYETAVENFNNAVLSGDEKQAQQAKTELENVQSVVEGMLSDDTYSGFASLFDAITESINNSALAAMNLKDALNSGNYQNPLDILKNYKREELSLITFDDHSSTLAERMLKQVMNVAKDQGFIDEVSTVNIPVVLDFLVDNKFIKGLKPQVETVNNTIFSSLFGENSEITKKVDDFQSNISSIQSALEKLKSGDYTTSDITDLIQQFPKLATETDNLNSALNSLAVDNFVSAMSTIRNEMKGVTDPTQLAAMNAFIKNLKEEFISSIDISSIDLNSTMNQLLSQANVDNWYKSDFKDKINQLWEEFGGTQEGQAAVFSLVADIAADPSLAYTDVDNLRSYIEDNEFIIKLNTSDENIKSLQGKLDKLDSLYSARKSEYDAKGYDYDEGYYNDRISESVDRQGILKAIENDALANLNMLKNFDRATAEQINDATIAWLNARSEYWNEVANQKDYEEALNNLPLDRLKNELHDIQTEADKLNDALSLKEAMGLSATKSDYIAFIKNSQSEVAKLRELSKELSDEQQRWLAEDPKRTTDSEYYLDLQSKIDEYDAAIVQCKIDQIEWTNAIAQIPLTKLGNELSDLQTEADKLNDALTFKTNNGIKPLFSDYKNLTNNSKDQVKNIQNQNSELRKQQSLLLLLLGDEAKNSEKYREIQEEINSNVDAINEARDSQLEWNDAADNLFYQENEGLLAYNKAKSSRNAGDNYLDMLSAAKEAQEARNKGLVGTDDFKTAAKMFSPNGMDDYENWDENYSKIQRYFTEDESGPLKFLEDLEAKQLAVQDDMGNWRYSIEDVQKSADSLGISFEAFLAIMGRLQDYGFTNDYFSSVDEGRDHLGKLYSELAQEEVKLKDLVKERDEGNATVTDAVLREQEAKVNTIRQSILDSENLLDQLMERSLSDYEAETKSAVKSVNQMLQYMNEAENEVTRKRIENDIEEFAGQYGIELSYDNSGNLIGLAQSAQEVLQQAMDEDPIEIKYNTPDLTNRPQVSAEKMWEYGWENVQPDEYATVYSSAYSNADETKTVVVTPILPNGDVMDEKELRSYADQLLEGTEIDAQVHLATFEGEDSVQQANNYSDALHAVQEAYYSEDESLNSLIASLKDYNIAQLQSIDLQDRDWDNNYPEAEQSIENILDSLGLGYEHAQALYMVLDQMGLLKIEPEVDDTEIQEAKKDATDPLNGNVKYTADTEEIDTKKQEIESNPIKQLVNFVQEKATGFVGKVKEYVTTQKQNVEKNETTNQTVNTTLNTVNPEEPTEKAQEYADSNPVKISTEVSGLTETPEVSGTGSIDITGNIDQAKSKADEAVDYINSLSGTEKIKGDSSHAKSSADATVTYINSLNPSMSIKASPDGISTAINNALRGPFSINVNAHVTGLGGLGGIASGTAHASGTAVYDKWVDYSHSIGAFANGTNHDWALKNDENALVNEVGQESIVRNGRWFPIPGGAHVEQLKQGDIIFNAKQTEELIKYGKVLSGGGHGRVAYSTGTAYNMMPARATLTPANGGSFINKTTSSTTTATKQNTSAVNKNTAAQNKSTKAATSGVKNLDSFKKWLEKLKDWIEVRVQRLTEKIDLNTTKSENAIGYNSKNSYLDVVQKTYKSLYDDQKAGENKYLQQADQVKVNAINAKLVNGKDKNARTKRANELIKLIQSGDINIAQYEEKEREFISAYTEWYDKAMEMRQAAEETLTNQLDLEKQKFDNISDEYDNVIDHIEHNANLINEYRDQNEAVGYVDSAKYYESLKSIEQSKINRLTEERKALVASLQKSMDDGIIKKGDARWYEMQTKINETSEAILEANGNLIDFNNSIRDIEWDKFDKSRDAVQRMNDEFDFMIELMSDEKMYDEFGKITNEGMATLALQASNYNVHMEQANEYAREYQKLTKLINSNEDNKNNVSLLQRQQDLLDKWRDNLKDAEGDVQSIKDTVQEGIDAELDALQKLIDKYNDALDAQKSLYDYQRNIKDQTSEVSKYQKQLNAYSNDMSEEGRLKYQQAQKNLNDAQENLKQSEYDRYISDQKDILSNLYDEYEKILNARVDDTNLLLENVIKSANENKESITTTLEEQAADVGYTMTEAITGVWGENGSATTILTTFSSDFSSKASALQTTIDQINKTVSDLYIKADKNAAEDIAEVNNTSTSGSNPQVNAPTPVAATPSTKPVSNTQTNTKQEEKLGPVSGIQGTLKKGAKNKNVGEMQKALKKMGYKDQNGKSLLIDNWFGPKTQYALKRFQKAMKISQTGILDAKTKEAFKKKGYAKGTDWIDEDEIALTQEKGREIITFPDGSMLTPLKRGSGVINNPNTEKVLSLADNHDAIMEAVDFTNKMIASDQIKKANDTVKKIADSAVNNSYGGNINVTLDNITFNLPNVSKPEDFMNYMMSSRKVQLAMQEYILGEAFGRTPGATRNHKF